jgi:hypothetical protein
MWGSSDIMLGNNVRAQDIHVGVQNMDRRMILLPPVARRKSMQANTKFDIIEVCRCRCSIAVFGPL